MINKRGQEEERIRKNRIIDKFIESSQDSQSNMG
jgi:hypothetical protein